MSDQPDLPALLGSRLCHDLISPIGAIGNGVELLLLDGGSGKGQELALISESVAALNARIRFLRIAFGVARPDQSIARSEVAAILADTVRTGRLSAEWISPADLARREVKAAFLLIMCAEHALPHGGKITICRDVVGWSLTAHSPRLRVTSDLWSLLSTATYPPPLTPAEVQFPLAALCLADLGRSPDLEQRDDTLRVSF